MSDSRTSRTRRPAQKPVFIVADFDPNNVEHMKGNVPIILNKALALELVRFIKESELSENEGHIYAFQGRLGRWYKERFEQIKKIKEAEATEAAPVEAVEELQR